MKGLPEYCTKNTYIDTGSDIFGMVYAAIIILFVVFSIYGLFHSKDRKQIGLDKQVIHLEQIENKLDSIIELIKVDK